MDAADALERAEGLELLVGLHTEQAKVECFAVPLRPGPSRRGRRWAFLVVTDAQEERVHEALEGYRIEFLDRRGKRLVLVGFPR